MKKVLIIIFLIVFFPIISYCKYISKINLEEKCKIVNPVISIENDKKIEITQIQNDQIEYRFSIKNYCDNEINKINYKYTIEIENTFNNENIIYELIDDDNEKKVELNNNISEEFFSTNTKKVNNYKLILNLNGQKNINGAINIKVKLLQCR